jgi:hypothetical protein
MQKQSAAIARVTVRAVKWHVEVANVHFLKNTRSKFVGVRELIGLKGRLKLK